MDRSSSQEKKTIIKKFLQDNLSNYPKLNKSVKAGETLLILEAMKMEHAVKAVSDGKISEMYVKTGDQVESGANLLKID